MGRDLSPPPVEMGNSEILSSVVPTDEMSASFHSTPDFHLTPQTLGSHIYLEFPTTTGSAGPEFYTGPLPVPTTTIDPVPHFYTASHTEHGPATFYTGPTPVTTHTPGPGLYK